MRKLWQFLGVVWALAWTLIGLFVLVFGAYLAYTKFNVNVLESIRGMIMFIIGVPLFENSVASFEVARAEFNGD